MAMAVGASASASSGLRAASRCAGCNTRTILRDLLYEVSKYLLYEVITLLYE